MGVGLAIWVLGLGLAAGRGSTWPELGNADVHEGRTRAGHIRPVPDDPAPDYAGILLAMIGSAIAFSVWWLIAMALIGRYFILQRLRGGA